MPTVFIGSGILLALFFGGWAVVYHLGAKNKETDLARYIEPQNTPSAPGLAIPAPALVSVDVVSGPAGGTAATPVPAAPFADPRKSGVNYLHVATLPWKDAEKAVEYLNRNGVAAAAAPAKPVDPFDARAKNLPHVVFAIDGVPSDQYRAMAAKRQALEERVRSIGKRWQREERGPSDFGQPGWSRFK